MPKKVIIIGAGIAGMTTASALAEHGLEVVLLEREATPGGHVARWDRLFPSLRPGREVLDFVSSGIVPGIDLRCNSAVSEIKQIEGRFEVMCEDGYRATGDALVMTTGFNLFDASRKEEYGYGIYNNVITSAELETVFRSGKPVTTASGKTPERIGLVHCVGSRDEKVGNLYCSKVCCVTGVKQAIELRQVLPDCDIFSFYMDLRMYDRNFEELYYEAQQKWGVNFIRGRVSECAENEDHAIIVKTEDTLTGRPLKITVDLLVLLVGFTPDPDSSRMLRMTGVAAGQDGFPVTADEHTANNCTSVPGLFLAGAVKGPNCIVDTLADARSSAIQVLRYLQIQR